MTAEETLKAKLPKGCIWEEGGSLTNTPIELVAEIMNEYADTRARQMAVDFAYDCLKSMYESLGTMDRTPFMEGKVKEFTEKLGNDCDTFTASTDRKEDKG